MKVRSWCVLALFLSPACRQGNGSDIGPNVIREPSDDWRLLVRDDQGRAVSAASVQVEGTGAAVFTGRSGRSVVAGRPSGRRTIAVDATYGSATDGDRLGRLTIAADTTGTDQLPFVIFVPDLAGSSSLQVTEGVQGAARLLDDSASSGARLGIDFGATVNANAQLAITIRTGKLSVGHHPPLPQIATGVRVCAGAVVVDPPTLTISPAASLSLGNDLRIASGGSADVLYLDPTNGSWTVLGVATPTDGGTRLSATGVVTRGGVYVFAATSGTTTAIDGRILDLESKPVASALVSVGEKRTLTGSDGRFLLEPVATNWADGAPRTLPFEVYGGRFVRPERQVDSITLVPGTLSIGDKQLDAPRVGTVRLLQISKGNREPGRRLRVSSVFGLSYGLGVGDDNGEATFEDQERGQTATNTGWISDDINYYLTESTNELLDRNNFLDVRLFTREQVYWLGRPRGTAVYPLDALGSGLIGSVQITRGQTPREGFVDVSRLGRPVTVDYGNFGEVTASLQTTSGSRTVISASSFVDPDSGRSEIPMERALRAPVGAFDRHGRVFGAIPGAGAPGTVTKIRATRRLCLEDWFDAVWFERESMGDIPRKLDPELVGGSTFDLGVPVPKGHLVALSGTASAGVLILDRLGWAGNLVLDEGSFVNRDVALTLRCDTSYTLPLALRDANPAFAASDFTFDLGVQLADGTILDLARGVGGTTVTNSETLGLSLPPLSLAGARRWLVALEASKTTGGKTITQKTFVPLTSTTGPAVTQIAVPDISEPAPGAQVPASGFTVAYTVPAGTSYIEVEARSKNGSETRVWHAVVHPRYSSYTFRELPKECVQPLIAGQTWTVTVTAARIETGPFTKQEEIYNRCTTSWVGLPEATREVNAIASTRIQVTTF